MMILAALLVLVAGFAALTSYARHDRFAGPRNVSRVLDDLGVVGDPHLVRFRF